MNLKKSSRALAGANMLAAALALVAVPVAARAADPDPRTLLAASVDDLYRGKSSAGVVEMHVKTKRWERTLKMKMWSKGTEKSLIRIVEPAKEKGVTTLKVDQNVWNYLPKVDRVIKVPASMMSGSWMGSHFTNDDLVKESRFSDDFNLKIIGRPEDGKNQWVIECIPKPDAPVVWGKVLVILRAQDNIAEQVQFYDEKGGLVRTMTYSNIRLVDGKPMPLTMRMVPADSPQEFTEVKQVKLSFNLELADSVFTLQSLRK